MSELSWTFQENQWLVIDAIQQVSDENKQSRLTKDQLMKNLNFRKQLEQQIAKQRQVIS